MNRRLLSPLIAAAAGIAAVAASAETPGQIGSRSEASISIKVSVNPRVQVRSREMLSAASGRLPVMCVASNLPPASFTMTALPNPGRGSQSSLGDARQTAISGASVGCGSIQSTKADLAVLALSALEAATKDQRDQGSLVIIVRPE